MRAPTSVVCVILALLAALASANDVNGQDGAQSTDAVESTADASDLATTEYRGVNLNPELIGRGDIAILARTWGVNLVRVCMASSDCGLCMTSDESPLCSPIDLTKLDSILDWCEEYGIRAVIDLHHFAGYNPHTEPQDFRLWDSRVLQDAFVEFWKSIATRYADRGDVIYGYDLLNEPHTADKRIPRVWDGLIARTAGAIRQVDNEHAIVAECGYGLPENFMPMELVKDSNVVYSFHFGEPYDFTHQGHIGKPAGLVYPNAELNKEYLRSLIRPAWEFKQRHGVQIYVGELIAYCYIDTASRIAYLRDCLDLFEEYGFDYTYWAYRSWAQASLEHVGYRTSTKWRGWYVGETEAQAAFKEYLVRNELRPRGEAPLPRARCLFDRAHWQQDLEINVCTLNLAWRVTAQCEVEYFSEGRFTAQALEGVALLITGNAYGTPYSTQEVELLKTFIAEGGSVLVYGAKEWGLSGLLESFGIELDPTRIASSVPSTYTNDPYTFYVTSYSGPSEISTGLLPLTVNRAASLVLAEQAMPIAWTGDETWRDVNRNGIKDQGEAEGPFAVIAVSTQGAGRLAVTADDEFRDVCTWNVYQPILSWLLEGSADHE